MSCRTDEGGQPLCPRGVGVKTVELRGRSLFSIDQYKQRVTNKPTAEGGPYKIVFVADWPDKWDNNNGYIGHARGIEKVIELCQRANIDTREAYFTYLTRCFTYKKPSLQEQKACTPYTVADIERLQPEVVVLLGAAAQRLFNLHTQGGVTKMRGKVFDLPIPGGDPSRTYKVVATYDPAVFFHRSDSFLEQRILDDYRMVKKLADKKDIESKNQFAKYISLETPEAIRAFVDEVKKRKFFAFDTESRGLPWSKEPMILVSFSIGEGENYIIPFYHSTFDINRPDGDDGWKLRKVWHDQTKQSVIIPMLREIFEDPSLQKCAHNIKYDINVLRKHLGIRVDGFLYDTMLMHHLLNEQKPHDLEYLMDIEFGTGNYSYKVEEIVGKGKVLKRQYDCIPNEILWEYTATDVEGCFKLAKIYIKRLKEKPHLWKLYWDESAQMTKILAEAEWYGHAVNMDTHALLVRDYEERAKDLLAECESMTWKDFNPNSSPNVQKAVVAAGFGDKLKDKKTMAGYSTGKEKLDTFKHELPLVAKILEYRNTQKMLGTYLENVVLDREDDGRVRYNFMIHGTESGRLSCRFLHQLPRVDKKRKVNMRDMLVSDSGYKLVYFDYDQIEMRVLTELSGDINLGKIFCYPQKETVDVHRKTAAIALTMDYETTSDYNRQEVGKSVNFGLAYGSEGHRLVAKCQYEDKDGNRNPITWDMLNRIMERFKAEYPSLTMFLESQPDIARRNGNKLITPFGRERRMGGKLNDPIEGVRKAAEREIVNFVIQSTAVAVTFRSLIVLDSAIRNLKKLGVIGDDDIRLINTVHDSGTYEVLEVHVPLMIDLLKQQLNRPIPELGNRQFPCAIGVGVTSTRAEKDKIAQ